MAVLRITSIIFAHLFCCWCYFTSCCLFIYIIKTYYTSQNGIWRVISRVASYVHETKASANTAFELNNIPIFHDECSK